MTLALLLLLAQSPQAALARGYRGPEGQRVEVVTLLPLAEHRALVRISGAGSPADGLVLEALVTESSRGVRTHTARVRGADWVVLRLEEGRGEANAPDTAAFTVKFDEAAKVEPAPLIELHLAQRERGELALLAKKPFPHLVQKYEAAASAAVAKTCDGRLGFTFAWATFSDEVMAEVDAWKACEGLVVALRGRCGATKGLTRLVCRMGAQPALERAGDTLTFTTTPKGAATGAAFVRQHLE